MIYKLLVHGFLIVFFFLLFGHAQLLSVCVLSVKGTVSEVGLRGIVVQGELRARREKRPQGVR